MNREVESAFDLLYTAAENFPIDKIQSIIDLALGNKEVYGEVEDEGYYGTPGSGR
jgi:hypothetical protein